MFPFVRNGNLDVVIVAGPHITCWPSVGVRTLSSICSASGLSVGIYGGPELMVKGVLPLHQTGGILFIEDTQKRIHRLHARSVIKIADKIQFPLPFECWHSEGLMLLSTIEALNKTVLLNWTPRVVILGTSNSALSFGSFLLNSKSTTEVICLEIFLQWGAKRYEGWETEKRRFEILGGKIVEGKPLSLTKKTAQTWEFVIQIGADAKNFEVSRVVSAGSFYKNNGIKEYPPGSLLFELEQTAPHTPENNMEGWTLEEKRATMLGLRVSKALSTEAGSQKKENQYLFKKTKIQLKNIFDHHDKPWSPTYHGKWLSKGDMKLLKSFSGVPQKAHCFRPIATIECFEHIPCNLCEKACPEGAIKLTKDRDSVLTESKCTGCGICLTICPSQSIALVHEKENNSISEITLPTQGSFDFKSGNSITLLNRRGESLESGKVLSHQLTLPLIRIGVPTHLLWETRGYKKNAAEQHFLK
ncbi:MAG: 4Fe-4S dicluster domain-containing protein [Deltaproteobacteria bacterium]|nr:4Fe-4S dicluster domain-containing protein [Deltaproteobacteria bacterium]